MQFKEKQERMIFFMEKSQMKNIVVLKSLPSNLIEEAIVILKSNKTAKKLEYIEQKENIKDKVNVNDSTNYIIREAESVISNYINTVEKNEKSESRIKVDKKYKKLKIYSIIVTIGLILFMIV